MSGYVLRAPWYERERQQVTLRDPQALRPAIQKYATPDFSSRIVADPRACLAYDDVDLWSYPVPVTLGTGKGRQRLATHTLKTTRIRKLFQPTHERFYAVVVEVFCDEPGLPRAGSHDDLEVGFVLRRRRTTLSGDPKAMRRLARDLIVADAKAAGATPPASTDADSIDLAAAELAADQQFVEDHGELLAAIEAEHETQAWVRRPEGPGWTAFDPDAPSTGEEELRMWRIPPEAALCENGRTRSLWFGVVPTFSGEHWRDPTVSDKAKQMQPKLDDREIYEVLCCVREPADPDKPDCPRETWWSAPSRPFRLAAPFDPDGTQNHTVSITAPDLRRLAARSGRPLGPGGARIITPPGSALPPVPFGSIPGTKPGLPDPGGTVCLFAFELFFLVALFLFLLFLPIIVFMFQLWWLLALRFCLPFDAIARLTTFVETHTLDQLILDGTATGDLDAVTGMPGTGPLLKAATRFDPTTLPDLVAAMDPRLGAADPAPPTPAALPDDPLCPAAPP